MGIYIEGMKGTSLPFPFSVPLSLHTKVRQGGSRGGTFFSILNNFGVTYIFLFLGMFCWGGGIGGCRY